MKNRLSILLFAFIFISCSEKNSPDPNADWLANLQKNLCVKPIDTLVFNPGKGEKTVYKFTRMDQVDSSSGCPHIADFKISIQNFKESGDAADFFREEAETYLHPGEPHKTPVFICLMGHSVISLIGECATKEYMDITFEALQKSSLPAGTKLPAGNTIKNYCGGDAEVL